MTQRGSDRRFLHAVFALLALVIVPVVVWASDHIITLPAVGFAPDLLLGNVTITYQRNAADQGYLTEAAGNFYAAVPFFHFGRNVCAFTLYVRDNDGDGDATARLMKKGAAADSAFTPATEMAAVSSSGGAEDMRAFTTTTINSPAVSGGFFYFVELSLPPDNNMQVLGVNVVYRPTC